MPNDRDKGFWETWINPAPNTPEWRRAWWVSFVLVALLIGLAMWLSTHVGETTTVNGPQP